MKAEKEGKEAEAKLKKAEKAEKICKAKEKKETKAKNTRSKKNAKGGKPKADAHTDSDTTDGECPNCAKPFSEEALWVWCEKCEQWYDTECQSLSKKSIPDHFYCSKCV